MFELNNDLQRQISMIGQISQTFNDNQQKIKDLSNTVTNLKNANENLKDNNKKNTEQLKTLRQICNQKQEIINNLFNFEKKNQILIEENEVLFSKIKNLEQKVVDIESEKDVSIQRQINFHKEDLKATKQQFEKQENDLKKKIEILEATLDIQIFEKNNEIENLKVSSGEKLKLALKTENQLKQEVLRLNSQLTSNTAVLQKKILELEQKVKTLERDKSLYNISNGNFISANILKNLHEPQSTITQNTATQSVPQNTDNTSKKFQFRKSNRMRNENQQLLSETFNPFQNRKQLSDDNVSMKNNTQINSKEFVSTNENESENSLVAHELNMFGNENKNTKPHVSVRKRKMFDPNNVDYLL